MAEHNVISKKPQDDSKLSIELRNKIVDRLASMYTNVDMDDKPSEVLYDYHKDGIRGLNEMTDLELIEELISNLPE